MAVKNWCDVVLYSLVLLFVWLRCSSMVAALTMTTDADTSICPTGHTVVYDGSKFAYVACSGGMGNVLQINVAAQKVSTFFVCGSAAFDLKIISDTSLLVACSNGIYLVSPTNPSDLVTSNCQVTGNFQPSVAYDPIQNIIYTACSNGIFGYENNSPSFTPINAGHTIVPLSGSTTSIHCATPVSLGFALNFLFIGCANPFALIEYNPGTSQLTLITNNLKNPVYEILYSQIENSIFFANGIDGIKKYSLSNPGITIFDANCAGSVSLSLFSSSGSEFMYAACNTQDAVIKEYRFPNSISDPSGNLGIKLLCDCECLPQSVSAISDTHVLTSCIAPIGKTSTVLDLSNIPISGISSCAASTGGDPLFHGFSGQIFQIYGLSDTYYNLLTSPCLNVHAKFSFLSERIGRRPHQLKDKKMIGISSKQFFQTHPPIEYIQAKFLANSTFLLKSKETTQWSHAGNYMNEIGLLIYGQKILIRAGKWENGQTVFVNDEFLQPGAILSFAKYAENTTTTVIEKNIENSNNNINNQFFSFETILPKSKEEIYFTQFLTENLQKIQNKYLKKFAFQFDPTNLPPFNNNNTIEPISSIAAVEYISSSQQFTSTIKMIDKFIDKVVNYLEEEELSINSEFQNHWLCVSTISAQSFASTLEELLRIRVEIFIENFEKMKNNFNFDIPIDLSFLSDESQQILNNNNNIQDLLVWFHSICHSKKYSHLSDSLNGFDYSIVRLSTHQTLIVLPYLSFVITNADGFLNIHDFNILQNNNNNNKKKNKHYEYYLQNLDGLLGQTYYIHAMTSQGKKKYQNEFMKQEEKLYYEQSRQIAQKNYFQRILDFLNEKQFQTENLIKNSSFFSKNEEEIKEMKQLAVYYNEQRRKNDERLHIIDFFVDEKNGQSQAFISQRFVKNAYNCQI